MNEKPTNRRRWFQFRFSTWFVLIAIVAWAMAYWPPYKWEVLEQSGTPVVITSIAKGHLTFTRRTLIKHGADANGQIAYIKYRNQLDRRLTWPALTLAAFLTWKAFWRIRERRREGAAQSALG